MYKCFSLLVLLFVQGKSYSQPAVIVNNHTQLKYAESNIYFLKDSTGNLSFGEVRRLPDRAFAFQPQSPMSFGNTDKPWWFKIHLKNETAQDLYLLFQNHEIRELDCYVVNVNGTIDSIATGINRPFDNRIFKINTPVIPLGKEPAVIFLRIRTQSMWLPMQVGTLSPIVSEIHHIDIFTLLIIGVMLALAIYNMVFFFLLKERLYLYYFGYVLFSVSLIVLNRGYFIEFLFHSHPGSVNALRFLNTGVAVFTILFTAKYLDTKNRAPRLHKILLFFLYFKIGMRLLLTFFSFQAWFNTFYEMSFMIIMIYTMAVAVYIYRRGYKPALFYIVAFSIMYVGVFISIFGFAGVSSFNNFWVRNAYHIGAVTEAFILSFAVAYRFNLYKKEAHEKELQLVRERNRIMADLHDDIGASLSSMSIYGDLAGTVWQTKPEESKKLVDKISHTSKGLMERMGDIIWSMKPADEDKYTLEARLKNYCNELLSPKNIVCEFDIDAALATSITNPEVRKNILLIAKEAINNIVKYSEASGVMVAFKRQDNNVLLSINDNGKGYEAEKIKTGNGLQNIKQRCAYLDGKCSIVSFPKKGVSIECIFPIAEVIRSL